MRARSCAVVQTGTEGIRLTVTPTSGRRIVLDFHRTDAEAVGAALVDAVKAQRSNAS